MWEVMTSAINLLDVQENLILELSSKIKSIISHRLCMDNRLDRSIYIICSLPLLKFPSNTSKFTSAFIIYGTLPIHQNRREVIIHHGEISSKAKTWRQGAVIIVTGFNNRQAGRHLQHQSHSAVMNVNFHELKNFNPDEFTIFKAVDVNTRRG